MRVLLVDDDPSFRKFTSIALETAGIEFEVAEDGAQGLAVLEAAEPERFDAVLLDVEMPKATGFDLLAEVREKGNEVPVLFVTGRSDVPDRVSGLRLGADDYIAKPVEYEELIARIEAVVRRRRSLPTLSLPPLRIDLARRAVEHTGRPVELSPREFDLLLRLAEARGEPVSREELLSDVWGLDFDPGTNVIDVHIGRLRKKLNRFGPSIIETVRGRGYRVRGEEEDAGD